MPGRDPIPGYLSLHHNQNGLTLKWTPNQLMNGYTNETKALVTKWVNFYKKYRSILIRDIIHVRSQILFSFLNSIYYMW